MNAREPHNIMRNDDDHLDADVSDYLWDPASSPDASDADIQRLEALLRPLAHRPGSVATAPITPRRASAPARRFAVRRDSRPWRPLLALAALVAIAAAISIQLHRPPTTGWEVASLQGAPLIGGRAVPATGQIRVGQWLQTDDNSRAQLRVASLGSVTVEGGSKLRLVRAAQDEKRLELQRGTIHAFIVAPPRLFFVDTPAAIAADMGCAYTLNVGDDGAGQLEVTVGWVELERPGRHTSIVPAGAVCRMDPKSGPGTPHFASSSPEFVDHLNQFDAGSANQVAALARLATPRDALTLWHLIPRVAASQRDIIVQSLAHTVPLPPSVSRDAILALDQGALDAWWDAVRMSW